MSYISKEQKLIGSFFKQKRLQNKTKVTDLCSVIQKSTSYYYNLERDLVPFNTLTVRRLFDYYGVKYGKSSYCVRS